MDPQTGPLHIDRNEAIRMAFFQATIYTATEKRDITSGQDRFVFWIRRASGPQAGQ